MNVFWMCIGIAMVLVGLGCFIYRLLYCRADVEIAGASLVALGVIIFAMSLNGIEHDTTEKQLAQVEHYYLDGSEVNPDTIDIDLYQYSIKGNNCYLTAE